MRCGHITPCLLQPHQLPVCWRIPFKRRSITLSVATSGSPIYAVSTTTIRLRFDGCSTTIRRAIRLLIKGHCSYNSDIILILAAVTLTYLFI